MEQERRPSGPGALPIVLWSLAAEPAILALLALWLRSIGAVKATLPPDLGEKLLVVFLVVASIFAWLSFRLASGRIPERLKGSANPQGLLWAAIGLAVAPGVLGFVHYLLFGQPAALLLFNGGATVLAISHIMKSD